MPLPPRKRPTPVSPEFEATFATLKALLRKQVPKALVVKDAPGDFQVASPTLVDRIGRPLVLAMVQIRKSYVSLHLIPVYAIPALAATVSPSLKKRMQGKACFNFATIEPAHVKELAALTKRGAAALERVDLPWARKRR
jgi:hypothetical protein